MFELRVHGEIESIVPDKTSEGKPLNKLYFRRDFDKGGFDSVVVTDYDNTPCKIGDDVEMVVYCKPWVSKRGVAAVSYVAVQGTFTIKKGTASDKPKV